MLNVKHILKSMSDLRSGGVVSGVCTRCVSSGVFCNLLFNLVACD